MLISQRLESPYVIRRRLMRLLESKFGRGNFKVKNLDDSYVLYIPVLLTHDEIRSCYDQGLPQWSLTKDRADSPDVNEIETPKDNDNSRHHSSSIRGNIDENLEKTKLPLIYSGGWSQPLKIPYQLSGLKCDDTMTANWEISPDLEEVGLAGTVSGSWDAPRLANGQTSSVYAVNALLTWTQTQVQGDALRPQLVTVKLAVKQLHNATTSENFFAELDALKLTRNYNHPNIVQVLEAFRLEQAGKQTFNLLFSRAVGNLKELFRGSLDSLPLISRSQELWGQLEGLASALEYLHDKCRTAHRDIKPSNLLLYDDVESGILRVKIADFGLAINLQGAISWSYGTAEARSAWNYDAPEIRRHMPEIRASSDKPATIPTPDDLRRNDIYKLGGVFTQLLTFLLLKSRGMEIFRKFITNTVDGMISDTIEEFRFDDGEKVKVEVLEWLSMLSHRSPLAAELQSLLTSMLDDALGRPTANAVSQSLREFSSCFYLDGTRIVRFSKWDRTTPPGILDICKESLESFLQSKIDWWPLAQGVTSIRPGNMQVFWKWHEKWLTIAAPTDAVLEYRAICVPVSQPPGYPGQPPPTYTPGSLSQPVAQLGGLSYQGGQLGFPLQQISNQSGQPHSQLSIQGHSGISAPQAVAGELYWCIEKPFSDLHEMGLSNIDVRHISSDEELFLLLRAVYNRRRGILSRVFSWKSCQDVEFIQFCINKHGTEHISRVDQGLPHNPPHSDYWYTAITPDILHMKMIGTELVTGMRDPNGCAGFETLNGIPKRSILIPTWNRGDQGWGIRAIQGWSLKKVSLWILGIQLVGTIHAIIWLVFINSKDLQNAFTPMAYLYTAVLAIMGIPALLNIE